jgi:hypothetical protein
MAKKIQAIIKENRVDETPHHFLVEKWRKAGTIAAGLYLEWKKSDGGKDNSIVYAAE